jgi:Arc/MetJ-type ribon-helix-helix transcriptional regulator
MSTTQVAVRMERDLLERLDWLVVHGSFETRAEAIRAAIDSLAKQEREREIDEQIVAAYTRMPQTPAELEWLSTPDFSAWDALDDEDWSDWE